MPEDNEPVQAVSEPPVAHNNDRIIASTSRVEAYSDAIIAIIMTLLIFDLKIPHITPHADTATFWREIRAVLPNFLTFALSFLTLAVVWINHHHFFHHLRGTNRALLWINNGLLFFVCLIPFATGLLSGYEAAPLSVVWYGVTMLCVVVMFAILIWYVFFKANIVNESVAQSRRRREFRRSLAGVVAYFIAAVVALWWPWLSVVMYCAVPLYYLFPNTLE